MNYWFISLPRADLEHCIKIGVFGLSRKNLIGKVCRGDRVVCCAGKGEWKVIALGDVTSDYYLDDEKVFLKPGSYPDRFKFAARKLAAELDVASVVQQLTFITNPQHWPVYFRTGIAKMSQQDWEFFRTFEK